MRVKTGNFSRKQLVIAIVLALLFGAMLERVISRGTLFGYQIRTVESPLTATEEQPSLACKKVDEKAASAVLGVDVVRMAATIGDIKQPSFMSICTYRTRSAPNRSITLVMREVKDESTAKSQFAMYAKRGGAIQLKGIGDQAIFLEKQNQVIVRKGEKVITATVSDSTNKSTVSSKDAAAQLVQKLL